LPGAASEARAAARREASRDTANSGLFGPQGMLAQLRQGEEVCEMPAPMPVRAIGPPRNGERREAERRAAKEAKVQQLLEDREARLSAENAEARQKREAVRVAASSAAAPAYQPQYANADAEFGPEDWEQRISCKKEILGLLNGYTSHGGKASAEQAKELLERLQERGAGGKAMDAQSVHQRLQQMSETCDRAFDDIDF